MLKEDKEKIRDFFTQFEYEKGFIEIMETYKHIWIKSKITGNVKRYTKEKYKLQNISFLLNKIGLAKLPKFKVLCSMLGRKPMYDEFYAYYVEVLEKYKLNKDMGKWHGEFEKINGRMLLNGIDLKGKKILDISGEPGFFARRLLEEGASEVIVSAYNENVAKAIYNHLGVPSIRFDFNKDKISELLQKKI